MLFFVVVILSVMTVSLNAQCTGAPNDKRIRECCNIPVFINPDMIEKCKPFYHPMKKPEPGQPFRGSCFIECVANNSKTGLLENNMMNKGKMVEWLQQIILDVELMQITSEAIESCFKEGATRAAEFAATAKLPPQNPDEKVCHPISGFILMCTQMHILKSCPTSKIILPNDHECTELRNYAQRCPYGPK